MSNKTTSARTKTRIKKNPQYRSFKLHKRIKAKDSKPLPSSWQLWKMSVLTLRENIKPITLFLLVFAGLYILFVRGLSGGVDLSGLKSEINEVTGGSWLLSSATLFSIIASSSVSTSSDVASLYQTILLIIGSLAYIWLLRQITTDRRVKVRIRDSFYRGMAPLVPFVLVLAVILLELIPMAIGSFLLQTVTANGIAASGTEIFAVISIVVLLAILSLYLVSGSLMAVYIVTLPGMDPVKSLRTSSRLLALHRWSVLRKLIVLLIIVLILSVVVFIPLLLLIPSGYEFVAEGLFFLTLMLMFALGHTYFYSLYRSLL